MKIAQAFDQIWQAVDGYRETCIPEGDELYDDEYKQICIAMNSIHKLCMHVKTLRSDTDDLFR
jgi:hypothetical protein